MYVAALSMEQISPHSELAKVVDVLKQPLKSRSQREIDSVVSYLSCCPYFQRKAKEVCPEFPQVCARMLNYEVAAPGQVLYTEGDSGHKLYVLLSGSVAASARVIPLLPLETFGEEVLECGSQHQQTVTALTLCHFAVLYKTDYFDILDKLTEKSHLELLNFLHSLPAFARISRGALQRILASFETRVLAWKQLLCKAGDPADEVYIVKQGEFSLLQAIPVRKLGSPRESFRGQYRASIALVGPGEFIGEEDVLRRHSYSQTCVCHSLEGQVLALQAQVCFI